MGNILRPAKSKATEAKGALQGRAECDAHEIGILDRLIGIGRSAAAK
jgi:hypothetical protein